MGKSTCSFYSWCYRVDLDIPGARFVFQGIRLACRGTCARSSGCVSPFQADFPLSLQVSLPLTQSGRPPAAFLVAARWTRAHLDRVDLQHRSRPAIALRRVISRRPIGPAFRRVPSRWSGTLRCGHNDLLSLAAARCACARSGPLAVAS